MSDNTFRTDGTIDSFPNDYAQRDYSVTFVAHEFTSVCPMTGQPDFGKLRITYVPDQRCIELRSFKFYLFTYRNEGVFYENVVNHICDDIVQAVAPRSVTVEGEFNIRGGIGAVVTARWERGSDVA